MTKKEESKNRVLVSDNLSEEGIIKLREFADVDVLLDLSKDELKARIADYDALVVRSGTKATKEIIEAGTRLKVIGRAGVGVDNIDVETATERGILVVNAPSANTISAAEHTIGMLLSISRNIPAANGSMKSGKWERKKYMGVEVNGKVLGVIGLGRVGYEVSKMAKGLGMRIVAYDPFISQDKARELGIALSSFTDVISVADFITMHTPLVKDTHHLIGKEAFAQMKEGVRVINCARGGILDEAALAAAIRSGKVAGAALDVFENEPPKTSELLELGEVIMTPHLGASTKEAQKAAAVTIAEEVVTALQNKPVRNALNMIYVEEELMDTLNPYLVLADKLGRLCAQLIPKSGRLEHFNVSYEGEIGVTGAGDDTRVITVAMLKSVLSWFTDGVNYVNTEAIAKKSGIKVTESKTEDSEHFSSLITLSITAQRDGKEEKKTVAGTLFGKDDLRIVQIDGYRVDASPSGHMLICSFLDKPKVIGPVCTVLGGSGINIAGMQVGREKVGGEAVMVLNVDSSVSDDTMAEIKRVQNVIDVKLVKL
ncbi:MAG: D-3-phosphoglycerate dehydrogenase [Candidatus Methanophagaceae archaeon]|nr:MAG: D-3-phosphoglycerate dehydrogenase [Methanophagales archaeon]KAF5436083.1 D-3-phosphoglycerate dehydrogenase [Methanophagales archaeon]